MMELKIQLQVDIRMIITHNAYLTTKLKQDKLYGHYKHTSSKYLFLVQQFDVVSLNSFCSVLFVAFTLAFQFLLCSFQVSS